MMPREIRARWLIHPEAAYNSVLLFSYTTLIRRGLRRKYIEEKLPGIYHLPTAIALNR